MNLHDALAPDHGAPHPEDELGPGKAWAFFTGLVAGYAEAIGRRLAVSTNGRTMRIHDLGANTRSSPIRRPGLKTKTQLLTAFRAQMDARPFWGSESDGWGPDPWGQDDIIRLRDGG